MYHFSTFFDKNYLVRGMALYRSLRRHCHDFRLHVLCLDAETHEALSRLSLPEMDLIPLSRLEEMDPELPSVKPQRSAAEYYWTLSPAFNLFLLGSLANGDVLAYLDADLYFFSSPEPFCEALAGGSILMVRHNYGPDRAWAARERGIYNAGQFAVRKDPNGIECLAWWRERCLEWCHRTFDGRRFASQMYLDEWPQRFEGVVVLEHPGCGVAPWNLTRYSMRWSRGRVTVDGQPLVFFHFHGFRMRGKWVFEPVGPGYKAVAPFVRWRVFAPYIRELKRAARDLDRVVPDLGALRYTGIGRRDLLQKALAGRLMIALGGLVL